MLNSTLLDTLIACVVVFLLLSLFVQAIQAACKKFFRLKSQQIEASLIDLFQNALGQLPVSEPKGLLACLKNLPVLGRPAGGSLVSASEDVKALYTAVHKGFKDIGRTSAQGSLMFDSLAKGDFLKVLDKVAASAVFGNAPGATGAPPVSPMVDAVRQALGRVTDLRDAIDKTATSVAGDAAAKAKFAEIEVSVRPLLDDLAALQAGNSIKADPLLGDLRKFAEAGGSLGQLLASVQKDLRAGLAQNAGLQPVVDGVDRIADVLAGLNRQLDGALAPLRARRTEMEHWFDTIMQSFEERYARGMKSWTFVISLLVAVAFNASVFDLYTNVSTDANLRAALVNRGQSLLPASGKPAADGSQNSALSQADIDALRAKIAATTSEFEMFGFRPFWKAFGPWWERSQQHDPQAGCWAWCVHWIGVFWRLLGRIIGWIAMALLLGVGAPFWQDALESLFGVKNLLRRNSGTQNVEQDHGGQPRP